MPAARIPLAEQIAALQAAIDVIDSGCCKIGATGSQGYWEILKPLRAAGRLLDGGEEVVALGDDGGWWLILYEPKAATVLGRLADQYRAQNFIERLAATILSGPHA